MNLDNIGGLIDVLVAFLRSLSLLRLNRETELSNDWLDCACGCGEHWAARWRWDANETGGWTKTVKDYDPSETQMARVWTPLGGYVSDVSLLEAADMEGETGSVSIACRRLKRLQRRHYWDMVNARERRVESYKCDANVSKRTDEAIDYLRENWLVIQKEGEIEQQQLFETQMARLGELDTEVEEWREDNLDTFMSFSEQLRSDGSLRTRQRFNRHHGW